MKLYATDDLIPFTEDGIKLARDVPAIYMLLNEQKQILLIHSVPSVRYKLNDIWIGDFPKSGENSPAYYRYEFPSVNPFPGEECQQLIEQYKADHGGQEPPWNHLSILKEVEFARIDMTSKRKRWK